MEQSPNAAAPADGLSDSNAGLGVALRRVVCAANRTAGGSIVCGARHFDSVMIGQIASQSVDIGVAWRISEQGFIDQCGNFMTRIEAWIIADRAGQILRRVGGDDANGGTLYSENLY